MRVAQIKESDWCVAIGAFVGLGVDEPREFVSSLIRRAGSTPIQLFDSDHVAGYDHLHMAAVNAVKAFQSGLSISKSIAVESLLYASTQDQISKAFDMLGVSKNTTHFAVMVFSSSCDEASSVYIKLADLMGVENDTLLELNEDKTKRLKELYNIGDLELSSLGRSDALTRLIIEKGALLVLRR